MGSAGTKCSKDFEGLGGTKSLSQGDGGFPLLLSPKSKGEGKGGSGLFAELLLLVQLLISV